MITRREERHRSPTPDQCRRARQHHERPAEVRAKNKQTQTRVPRTMAELTACRRMRTSVPIAPSASIDTCLQSRTFVSSQALETDFPVAAGSSRGIACAELCSGSSVLRTSLSPGKASRANRLAKRTSKTREHSGRPRRWGFCSGRQAMCLFRLNFSWKRHGRWDAGDLYVG